MTTMKKQRSGIYLMLAALLTTGDAMSLAAQEIAKGGICVEALKTKKENRQVSVEMTFDLSRLELQSNRFLTLTPRITDGTDTMDLRPLVISGRRQHIMYERERRNDPEYAGAEELRFRRGKEQKVPYRTMVPYERWMHGATLVVDEEWCGCGGYAQENRETDLMQLDLLPAIYNVTPLLAYVEPEAEAVKARSETGSAFLDFRVNRTEIDPEYRNNPDELARIRRTIERVKDDADLTIERITIHGYASPEGRYALNERLAEGRAHSLKTYVLNLYRFDEEQIDVSFTPEDWEGLRRRVEASGLPDKEQVLSEIDAAEDPDERELRLKSLGGGETFRYMLRDWFPALRHSDYTVHYTVRGFDVEEAARIIQTRPQKLSLNEMYLVSQLYEPGSTEFDRVFDIAVRMYPEDPTANLNAANIAIADGVYDKAEAYLDKAGELPEAIHARGVLALLRGEYDRARELLEQAQALGVEEAAHNLGELEKKMENDNQLK